MAAKALELSRWKAFAKGKQLRDAAYVDALEDWLDASNEIPRLRLEALEDLERCGEALLDASRGSKAHAELEAWLEDAGEAIEVERRKAQAEQAARAAEDHDFDNDTRVLTAGIEEMLRQVRRGRPTHALIARQGRRAAVRLARRPLQASARELLAAWLGASGGVRYLKARCTWEGGALTFVIDEAPTGLARLLRRAMLEQIGRRLKVRVRDEQATATDEVGDDDESDLDAAQAAPPSVPHGTASAGLAGTGADDAALQQQRRRLSELAPLLRQALQARRPDARKLGVLLIFADRKLRQRQLKAARQALDVLASRLAPPATAA